MRILVSGGTATLRQLLTRWNHEMKRLDWNMIFANAIRATHDEWVYTISCRHDSQWLLSVEPIQDRGPDWRKWYTTSHLQDAMSVAQALAAGADLAGETAI